MSYKYRSRRSVKKIAHKSKRNFILTLALVTFILYATLAWVLPFFITGLGFITGSLKPPQKVNPDITDSATLAPPILNIPYEATSTAQINVKGYATPNAKVKLFLDDEVIDTVSISDSGEFEVRDLSLRLGTNNFYAKAVDEKDQESLPSKTIKVVYDNEKPSLTLNEPEDNKTIQGGDKKVKLSGKTEVGIHIFINDSQIIIDNDGNFSTEQPLNEGDNNFNIKAVDQASNSVEISRKVTYSP